MPPSSPPVAQTPRLPRGRGLVLRLLASPRLTGQLGAAVLGAAVGLWLLLSAAAFFLEYRAALQAEQDLLQPGAVTLNKPVSSLGRLLGASQGFTEVELARLAAQPWVESVAPYTPARFQVRAGVDLGGLQGLRTELFMEALPAHLLDVPAEDWQWFPGETTVPLLLPKNYLDLYNFGLAPSRDLPAIGGEALELIRFDLYLQGPGGQKRLKGRIAGFSRRINSILVPQPFMEWANASLAPRGELPPSRVLVQLPDPGHPDFHAFVEQYGYDTAGEELKRSKRSRLLSWLLGALGGLGALTAGLALLVWVLSLQLVLARRAQELKLLLLLGYSPGRLFARYLGLVLGLLAVLGALAGAALAITLPLLAQPFGDEPAADYGPVWALGVGLLLTFGLLLAVLLWRGIRRLG